MGRAVCGESGPWKFRVRGISEAPQPNSPSTVEESEAKKQMTCSGLLSWRARGPGYEFKSLDVIPAPSHLDHIMHDEWPGGLLFFPAEKGQTAQAPMFGAPLSEASACMKGV